jgi:endonuclease/exonuclease/phosphatase family metal-dependent hydrolase
MKIRVLTYNIHGAKGTDRQRDYERIGLFLKAQKIDIALIQELDTRPPDLETAKDLADLRSDHFNYFAAAPTITTSHGWYGNAILSRFPVVRESVIDISHPGREPRNILEVFIDTPFGTLHVVNTHKGLSSAERGSQMKKLCELLARKSDIPLIVGGDMNHWHTYSKALRKLNNDLHAIPAGRTYPTVFPIFHLDRLWCRPHNLLQNSQVLKTKENRVYSDHYPLLAEIQFQP